MEKITVMCPSCESILTIDAKSGAIILHEEKQRPATSFEELKLQAEKQKQLREQLFAQEMASLKERERILEEKFKEAMKKAESKKSGEPFKNPLDLD